MKKLKEIRIVGQQEPIVKAEPPAEIKSEITFDQWWIMVLGAKKLKSELKTAIRKHFEARGFMQSKKFDDGLKDFGF
jgi:hypothetical protein